MKNANEILFRCSGLGHIMTENPKTTLTEKQAQTIKELEEKANEKMIAPKQAEELARLIAKRDAPPQLSSGIITHLVDVYLSEQFGRKEEIKNKILDKGNEREEDSITLVSLHTGRFFRKNEEKRDNGFIKGSWDLDFSTNGVITETRDTKTSWSMHTFMRAKFRPLDTEYYWQGVGYNILTNSLKHSVDYCLCNGTVETIMKEKRQASFKFIDPFSSDEYKIMCRQIEINHIFDRGQFEKENPHFEWDISADEWNYDVPLNQRIHTFVTEHTQEEFNELKNKVHNRVMLCREWMNNNLKFDA